MAKQALNVGIIGVGMVGGACKYGFEKLGHRVSVYDPKIEGSKLEDVLNTEIAFICVPTNANEDGSCDTSIVEQTVNNLLSLNYKGVIAIKSTVEPGFTQNLINHWPPDIFSVKICFVPEFLRERCAITDFTENHDLLCVGVSPGKFEEGIYDLVVRCHGKYPKEVVKLTPTEAELLKYYSNVFNALRVIFANEMYEICQALEADYTAVKNAFMLRKTATDIYMDVNENFRGYGGYCLLPETKIYTESGLKPIADIVENERVLTHTGEYKPVTELMYRDVDEELLKIKVQGITDSIYITKEHKILANKNNRKIYKTQGKNKLSSIRSKNINLDWIEAIDLSKGDYVAIPTPKSNNNDILNNEQARLLGYYLAEGSFDVSYYKENIRSASSSFAFHTKEELYHQDLINLISDLYNVDSKIQKTGNRCIIRAGGKEICEFLLKYGGKYSNKKKIPWNLLINSSNDVLKNIFIGYFRGDGSFSNQKYTCATVSKELFEQIKYILFSIQIPFTTKIGKERTDKNNITHKEAYYITIGANEYIRKLTEILNNDNNTRVLKSKTPIKIFDNYILYPIKSIERFQYNGPVYNLEVEDDHSYTTYGFIVHNCLPKDVKAMAYLSKKLNLPLDLFETIDKENHKFKTTVFPGMRL